VYGITQTTQTTPTTTQLKCLFFKICLAVVNAEAAAADKIKMKIIRCLSRAADVVVAVARRAAAVHAGLGAIKSNHNHNIVMFFFLNENEIKKERKT
jgi:hypothetical protein